MERKSVAGLCFILLILIASRVRAEENLAQAEDAEENLAQAEDAEEYLVQAEDAEEFSVQAEDAEEYLVLAEAKHHCWVRLYRPCIRTGICNVRCKRRGYRGGKCRKDRWCWCKKRHCPH